MDVFEMLGYVSGVAADEDYGVIVAWNGSATFNVFVTDGETFNNVDCRTVYYEADGSLSEIHDATANWGQRECERILAEIVNGEDEDDEDDE